MNARLLRYGFLGWLSLALVWAAIRWWVLVIYYQRLRLPAAGDLRIMVFAGISGVRHGWDWVYQPAHFMPALAAWGGPADTPVREPPVVALVLTPLSLVPWPAAAYLWLAVSAVLFAAGVLLISRDAAPSRRVALLAACFGFFPVFVALGQGNDTAIAFFGVALAYRLASDGREKAAGAALALALFKPQMMFLAPVALLAAGRWRLVAASALTSVGLVLATLLVTGPRTFSLWVQELGGSAGQSNRIWTELNTAAYYLPRPLLPVLILLGAAAAAWAGWRFRRSPKALEAAFAVGIVASLLATPYADPQEFSALLIAGWLLWRVWPRPAVGLALVLLYAGLTLTFLNLPSPVPLVEVAVLLAVLATTLPRLQARLTPAPAQGTA
ncbi:MAG TPA: glycosyltransferase family 87 protein [Candidatus Dormibacteraeota bacterium]